MKRLLLPLLAALALPTGVLADYSKSNLTTPERRAVSWLTFVKCKMQEGASKEWAEKELKYIATKASLDYELTKKDYIIGEAD